MTWRLVTLMVFVLSAQGIVNDFRFHFTRGCSDPMLSVKMLRSSCSAGCYENPQDGIPYLQQCNTEEEPIPPMHYASLAFYKTAGCVVWTATVEVPLDLCLKSEWNVLAAYYPLPFKSARVVAEAESGAVQLRTFADSNCLNFSAPIYPQAFYVNKCTDDDKPFPGILSYKVLVRTGKTDGIMLAHYGLPLALGLVALLCLLGLLAGCLCFRRHRRLRAAKPQSAMALDNLAQVLQLSESEGEGEEDELLHRE